MTMKEFTAWFDKQLIIKDYGCWEWPHDRELKSSPSIGTDNLFPQKTMRAHRLAWMFANKTTTMPDGKPFVLHSCDNPPCCNPEHLRAGTQKENVDDRSQRRRAASKLTEKEVIAIRREYATGSISQPALGIKYDVSPSLVGMIVNRKIWKYIEDPESSNESHPRWTNIKLTEDKVIAIRREYTAGGITQSALGVKYNVSESLICQIVNRKTWQHLPE